MCKIKNNNNNNKMILITRNAYESHYLYTKSTCVANFMLPPSIHFVVSIPLDARSILGQKGRHSK